MEHERVLTTPQNEKDLSACLFPFCAANLVPSDLVRHFCPIPGAPGTWPSATGLVSGNTALNRAMRDRQSCLILRVTLEQNA
jgi:hypothetical protein